MAHIFTTTQNSFMIFWLVFILSLAEQSTHTVWFLSKILQALLPWHQCFVWCTHNDHNHITISWKMCLAHDQHIGLCDNGKSYISIMHCKIISIHDYKSIVYLFWIFALLKLLCILSTCTFCIVHNSIWKFTIISIKNLLSLSQ